MDVELLLNDAMTMPAMSPMRVIVVKGAESLKADQQKALMDYINDPSPSTSLIFISNASKAGTSAFFKLLAKKGYIERVWHKRDTDLNRWINAEVRREGKEITGEAVLKLMQIAGKGLGEVKSELEKIILFVGEARQINIADVENAGVDVREESVFGLTDAIGAKDAGSAFKIYAKLTAEAPLMLLGSIARQMRIIMRIKELIESGTPVAKIAGMVGLYPAHAAKYIESSSRFNLDELAAVFKKLSRVDLELKGGVGGKKLPDGIVITKLIMELCGESAA
jgi:DNA polymerase-3 subunit delta